MLAVFENSLWENAEKKKFNKNKIQAEKRFLFITLLPVLRLQE